MGIFLPDFVQVQFSQERPVALTMAPVRMPFYPPGAPGMGQQFVYGQAPPAFIQQVITRNYWSSLLFLYRFDGIMTLLDLLGFCG